MRSRLQKILSSSGIASRRRAEKLIAAGMIKVNGKTVLTPGAKADPAIDVIAFNGKILSFPEKQYFLLNKPKGYISTVRDEFNRRKVTDLIDDKIRLYPVGRLDKDSRGLLLLTNDGEFALLLTHPRHHLPKTYIVALNRPLNESHRGKLAAGVKLEEGETAPCKIKLLKGDKIAMTIREGKKRQIKRMLGLFGYKVLDLQRTAVGSLRLGKTPEGKSRKLTPGEVKALKELALSP